MGKLDGKVALITGAYSAGIVPPSMTYSLP